MITQNRVGHTLQDRGMGRRLCDIMERIDRNSLHVCAEKLAVLTDPELLEQLKALPDDKELKTDGVGGTLAAKLVTSAGTSSWAAKDRTSITSTS